VSFADEAGRFERSGGEAVRTVGAWQPSAAQRDEIAAGLRVDPRGAREKRLRPTATGFASSRSAFDSARVVSFESQVELDLSGPAPRLVVSDSLGSSAAQALAGRTEYRGERVGADGAIEGRFERDGSRLGSFRMLRTGPPRGLGEPPPPPLPEPTRADVEDRLYRSLGRQLAASDALPERFAAEDPESRERLRARVRAELDARFAAQGNDPRAHAPALERLAAAIVRLYAEEGRSREEIGRLLEDGELRP
jgi:hypothetical protein